jgi:hypothetical protein
MFGLAGVVPQTTDAVSSMLNSFTKTDTITSLNGTSGSGEYSNSVNLAIETSRNAGAATRASTGSVFLDAISLGFNFMLIFTGINVLAIFYSLSLPTPIFIFIGLPIFSLYVLSLLQLVRTGFIPQ